MFDGLSNSEWHYMRIMLTGTEKHNIVVAFYILLRSLSAVDRPKMVCKSELGQYKIDEIV